jgi:hypothetical protein
MLFCFGLTFFFAGSDKPSDPASFPVPPFTKKSLFYIHRSTNPNTVIYEANFSTGNVIDPKDPVNVYWIRYGENRQHRGLNYLEKSFAYGVKCTAINTRVFGVEFVASKAKKMEVYIDADGQACAVMNLSGHPAKLRKIFVQVAEDGWWPRIDYVEFFGFDVKTNQPAYEKMEIE